jgi:hypothetical protein
VQRQRIPVQFADTIVVAHQVLATRVLATVTVVLTAAIAPRVPGALLLIVIELTTLWRVVVVVALRDMVLALQLRVKLQEESGVCRIVKLLSNGAKPDRMSRSNAELSTTVSSCRLQESAGAACMRRSGDVASPV